MNVKDRDFGTKDLEDIISEYSGGESEGPVSFNTADLEELKVLVSQEVPEKTAAPESAGAAEQPREEVTEPVDAATVRIDDLSQVTADEPREQEPDADATVRLNDIHQAVAEMTAAAEASEEEPEEYDDEDEDEVELPHLPPLVFRPRSRLGELKSKLVAGPEKRYYELTEVGVGKVQIAMLLCLLVIAGSGCAAVLYNAGMVPENRMRLMIFGQILAMLMGGLLGSQQMIDGVSDLLGGRFTLNTLLGITFAACCADSVLCLKELRVPICAAFTLEVAMSLWSAYHRRTTEMGQMDTMRKAVRLDSIVKCEDYYNGKPGYVRSEGQVEDFMDHYDEVSGPEKAQNRYALFSLLASVAIAVVAGMLHGVSMACQILTTTLLVAVPASMFISLTRPAAVLQRRLHSLGTVLCGWTGVKGLGAKGVIPVGDSDLFPGGSSKLNGVKFYGDREPDEVIAYAAALICVNGGTLEPIFQQLLSSRGANYYDAENLRFYGNGGIGGEVCGEPVLIGTLEFLKEMGVEVPEGTQVRQAVCVSIDGELSGLFAINYTKTRFATGGLGTLSTHRRVAPVILARDFMLTPAFLKEKFGIRNRRTIFPTRQEQEEMEAKLPAEDAPALALVTQEGLAPVAYAITGARALRTASKMGLTVHIFGGLLGLLIMLSLAIVGSVHLLTPIHVLLYQLVWLVPGWLVTNWTRTI